MLSSEYKTNFIVFIIPYVVGVYRLPDPRCDTSQLSDRSGYLITVLTSIVSFYSQQVQQDGSSLSVAGNNLGVGVYNFTVYNLVEITFLLYLI